MIAALALALLNPVLLVHGIDDTGASFDAMRPRLQAAGFRVETLDMVPNDGAASLTVLALQIQERIERMCREAGTERVDVVAFSLGGMASRYYLQRLDGARRVQRLVTVSTPHHGTLMGFLRRNAGARELRVGSAFLADLDRDWEETARQVQVTSIWTPFDLMIVPATSSRLKGSTEVVLPVLLHPWMLTDERCAQAVASALAGNQSSSGSSKSSSR